MNLILVALHALMGTFMASAIIPSYSDIIKEFGVSMQQASYLTSLQIAVLVARHFCGSRYPIDSDVGRFSYCL